MKKFIVSAMAAAAVAVGGAAQADIIDSIGSTISQIFGVPYDASRPASAPIVSVYTDAYGRQIGIDSAGRHIALAPSQTYQDAWGRTVPYAAAPSYDRDGDGVADAYDRAPYDARYR